MDYSPWGYKELDMTDHTHTHNTHTHITHTHTHTDILLLTIKASDTRSVWLEFLFLSVDSLNLGSA